MIGAPEPACRREGSIRAGRGRGPNPGARTQPTPAPAATAAPAEPRWGRAGTWCRGETQPAASRGIMSGFIPAMGQRNQPLGQRLMVGVLGAEASGRHLVPLCPSGAAAGQDTDLSPTWCFVAGNKSVTSLSLSHTGCRGKGRVLVPKLPQCPGAQPPPDKQNRAQLGPPPQGAIKGRAEAVFPSAGLWLGWFSQKKGRKGTSGF